MTEKHKDTSLRNIEYYGMFETFDKLYKQSENNIIFDDLMPLITSDTNIRLAYRNIKNNNGSLTCGVDKKTIKYIKKMKLESFVKLIRNKMFNYQPQEIRRIYIPKANGKQRPLGIPTITDRIIQQCIKQVLEPIVENKFHKNSNGFRPYKSCESAISQLTSYVYRNKCYYVVDIDIKGFFDNVNHGKLLKQLWTLKIRDKRLLKIISSMLKAKIDLTGIPTKGTPQGGILSPLLANIVLNELDWWLSNQWMTYHTKKEFKKYIRKNGNICSNERNWLRKNTKLKEFYFVRYADDFKIICKSYQNAVKLKIATINWLKERLQLEVSTEKTKIVNLKKNYSDFLGFKIKVRKKKKNGRYTIISHMSTKAKIRSKDNIKNNLKSIRKSYANKSLIKNINKYNENIIGIHNYYNKATSICIDLSDIYKELKYIIKKTLKETTILQVPNYLNNGFIEKTYGKSKCMISLYGMNIVPISYVQYKIPKQVSNKVCKYTESGRRLIHTGLECMNYETIKNIVKKPFWQETVELNDVIIPKCASQYGRCYVSNVIINDDNIDYIHKENLIEDNDKYQNIIIVDKNIKSLLLREGCGLNEFKKKFKRKENNRKTLVNL